TTGLPTLLQLLGFLLALLAITLISRPERTQGQPQGIWLAVLAGCCFGAFFILISRVQPTSTFWPLAAARITSVVVLAILLRLQRKVLLPAKTVAPLVALAGLLDAGGNAFFVLAAHS